MQKPDDVLIRLQEIMARYGGLSTGRHYPTEDACCVMEVLACYHNMDWTDHYRTIRCINLTWLNDVRLDDDERQFKGNDNRVETAEHARIRGEILLPVAAQYDGAMDWKYPLLQDTFRRLTTGLTKQLRMLPDLRHIERCMVRGVSCFKEAKAVVLENPDFVDRTRKDSVSFLALATERGIQAKAPMDYIEAINVLVCSAASLCDESDIPRIQTYRSVCDAFLDAVKVT